MVFKNPQGINTGEYGDSDCSDERLWAAAELWRTTGEAGYNDYFVRQYPDFRPSLDLPSPEGWKDVAVMGLWTYALGKQKGADVTVVAEMAAEIQLQPP